MRVATSPSSSRSAHAPALRIRITGYIWEWWSAKPAQLADDVHEWAKRKFLPPKFITVNGEEIKIPSSTTDLDKVAFGEFLDKLSAEIGIPLPNVEEAGYISNH